MRHGARHIPPAVSLREGAGVRNLKLLLFAFLLWAPAALAQDAGLARRLDAVLERAIAEQRVVSAFPAQIVAAVYARE